MLPHELLVVGERQRDHEGHDREQREVDDDREEPVAPDPLGPPAQSGGEAAEQDGREQRHREHLLEHP